MCILLLRSDYIDRSIGKDCFLVLKNNLLATSERSRFSNSAVVCFCYITNVNILVSFIYRKIGLTITLDPDNLLNYQLLRRYQRQNKRVGHFSDGVFLSHFFSITTWCSALLIRHFQVTGMILEDSLNIAVPLSRHFLDSC